MHNADTAHQNLTRHEWIGLASRHNMADDHARQEQSAGMNAIVDMLPQLFRRSEAALQLNLQAEFEQKAYRLAGQDAVLRSGRPVLHHYSSSLSIEIVANLLRMQGKRLGLLHPTFDNIASVLQRHGVELVEIPEDIFQRPEDASLYANCDAIFLVTPNNPTGCDPDAATFQRIIDMCQERGILLILDFSFRHFSTQLSHWDQYEYLERSGIDYLGIEDTAKTWPTLDLTVGSLVASANVHADVQRITDDLLLNVSPFIFALLNCYIDSDQTLECRRVAQVNRKALEAALKDTPVTLMPAAGPMSVGWIQLPEGWRSTELTAALGLRGIAVLPGGPFFWKTPQLGEGYIRIALMRPLDTFASSAQALAEELRRYTAGSEQGSVAAVDAAADDELAALVLATTCDVLQRDSVDVSDDFFLAGGDSFVAMHLVGRLSRQLGLKLRVRAVFDNPRIGDLIEVIRAAQHRTPIAPSAAADPSPAEPHLVSAQTDADGPR